MKKIFLLAVLSLSTTAFANVCEVEMVNTHTNHLIARFRAHDGNDGCKEGMKACRLDIRKHDISNAECIRDTERRPVPVPGPHTRGPNRPGPHHPAPRARPQIEDSKRHIENDEKVIYRDEYQAVFGPPVNGLYNLISWNRVTHDVSRNALAVTNGCTYGICTGDRVIQLRPILRLVKVIGLTFDNRYVIESTSYWNTRSTGIEHNELAVTKGCVQRRRNGQLFCVGNQVLDTTNRNSTGTVVAIQPDGRVVLQSTRDRMLKANVDVESLEITR